MISPSRWSLGVSATLLLLAGAPAAEETRIGDDRLVEVVEGRLNDWWLKPDERRFDLIGWADDIRTAKQLAAEHDRPVFLFTMDGRVNTGRC